MLELRVEAKLNVPSAFFFFNLGFFTFVLLLLLLYYSTVTG